MSILGPGSSERKSLRWGGFGVGGGRSPPWLEGVSEGTAGGGEVRGGWGKGRSCRALSALVRALAFTSREWGSRRQAYAVCSLYPWGC